MYKKQICFKSEHLITKNCTKKIRFKKFIFKFNQKSLKLTKNLFKKFFKFLAKRNPQFQSPNKNQDLFNLISADSESIIIGAK